MNWFRVFFPLLLGLVPFSRASLGAESPARWDRLYHGVAYYPELWPEGDIPRDIEAMKDAGINLVRMGEFAWSRMEPAEGKIDLIFFRRIMDQMHEAGIHVVLCTPTATPPIWLIHGQPDRCHVDADGRIMSHGARQHASHEHPAVRAASLRIVEAMARELGSHPALKGWQIDNEFKCHVAEDFSPSAIRAWHQWLEGKYGTIETLNEAWGTEVWSQRYQSFDQVPAPVRTPFLHNASLSTQWRIFSRDSVARFMDEQSATIRAHSVAPITHNTGLGFQVDFERLCRNLDFISWDDYPPAQEWERIVRNADMFRPAIPGTPFWLMETSPAHNGWLGNHEILHPPGFLRAQAVAAYALGGQAFNYWLWRQQRAGCELPHGSIFHAWFAPTIGYEEVQSVGKARQALEPLLLDGVPAPAGAAVTWSDRARIMMQVESLGSSSRHTVDYRTTVDYWHGFFLHLGYHREFRFEGSAPDEDVKLLVTPAMPAVDQAFLDRIRPWVENGGIWICGPLTGTRTAEHTVPTTGGLGMVEDLAGVRTRYSYPVTGSGARIESLGLSAPLAGWCSAVEPIAPEVNVLGTLRESRISDGHALLTERPFGKGLVVLLTTSPTGEEGNRLIGQIIRQYADRAGLEPFPVSPGTLVCPRRQNDGRHLWIAVNMNGQGGLVRLPEGATDAIDQQPAAPGETKIAPYEWRAWFMAK